MAIKDLFEKGIDPSRIALGCKPIKDRPHRLKCRPRYKTDSGNLKPLTKDLPLVLKETPEGQYIIEDGGDDLTVKEVKAINKAIEKTKLP